MQRQKNPFLIGGIAFGVVCVVIVIIAILSGDFNKQALPDTLTIDNFDVYEKNIPDDLKETLFVYLFKVTKPYIGEGEKELRSGAMVREGTYTTNLDTNKTYVSGFIVDIEKKHLSFRVFYSWSNDAVQNGLNGGYQVRISCVEEYDKIYEEEQPCLIDNSGESWVVSKYPIIEVLPIKIDRFYDNYSKRQKYIVNYELLNDGNDFKLVITDYTGGNYEEALSKIRSRGYNPDDYEIRYVDQSSDENWGRAV